jgi:hypothetical protein
LKNSTKLNAKSKIENCDIREELFTEENCQKKHGIGSGKNSNADMGERLLLATGLNEFALMQMNLLNLHENVGVSKIYDNLMILLSFKEVDIGALPYEK